MGMYSIRNVSKADLDRCFEIERISYAGGEAATREKIEKRIAQYPEGFIVMESDGVVVGFINCGATDHVDLANEAFKDLVGHDPEGAYIVVFSVVVHKEYQGSGFAGKLMTDFIRRAKKMGKASIHLICRDNLIGFYAKYGFEYVRPSNSTHGGLSWHEMMLRL